MALNQLFRWPFARPRPPAQALPLGEDYTRTARLWRAPSHPAEDVRFTAQEIALLQRMKEQRDGPSRVLTVSVRRCRICRCTDDRACPGGCWWVGPTLCSACEVTP